MTTFISQNASISFKNEIMPIL